jgi:hypothetical protein
VIHVVTGHICSGKSTWVQDQAGPFDIIIDLDRIAAALKREGESTHDHEDHLLEVAAAARWTAIDRAVRCHAAGGFDLWIIHAYPTATDMATYRRFGAAVKPMEADKETLIDRARRTRGAKQLAHLVERLNEQAARQFLHEQQKGL